MPESAAPARTQHPLAHAAGVWSTRAASLLALVLTFTGFTSTKVQKLTLQACGAPALPPWHAAPQVSVFVLMYY